MDITKYKLVLMFHNLNNNPKSKYDFKWNRFKNYILILNYLFKLVNKKIENKILVTFDDGYYSSMVAARYLQKYYKINSIVFISTNNLDKKGYLKKDQIKNKNHNIFIGSHGMNHISLGKHLNSKKIYTELYESQKTLSTVCNININKLSFPNGIYCNKSLRIARELNFNYIFTSKRASNRRIQKDKTINRFVITKNTNLLLIIIAYTGLLDEVQTLKNRIYPQ